MAFTTVQKIRFDDVDGAGIVYYPHFYHLCHKTFEDFFDDAAGLPYPHMIRTQRKGFPTVAINSSFSAPLSYGDAAEVTLAIRKIGTSSVVFHYRILRQADKVLSFEADITTVYIDLDSQRPVPIPEELRTLFAAQLTG